MCRDFIQFNRIYRDLMGFYRDWYGVLHFEWKRYQHLGNARLVFVFPGISGLGSNRLHHKLSFQGSGDDATLEMFIRFRPCSLHGFQENKTKLDHRVGKPWFPKDFFMNQDDLFTTWKVMTMNPGISRASSGCPSHPERRGTPWPWRGMFPHVLQPWN